MRKATRQQQGATVVVGLGATGLACLRFLHARGCRLAAMDSRADPPALPAVKALASDLPLSLGALDPSMLVDAGQVIVSPGVAANDPALEAARSAGVPVFGEIELFARNVNAPVVAITGSNGKSTVTTLLGEMAARAGSDAAVGGNLGTPALDLLRSPAPDAYILELSSFQLETTSSLRPLAAAVLNISADHMDRHGNVDAYAAIKSRIYNGDGRMVLNADDPRVAAMARPGRRQTWFSTGLPAAAGDYGLAHEAGRTWLMRGDTRLLAADAMRIRGLHNLANALAALALAEAMRLASDACLDALRDFPGLPHRTCRVRERRGVHWYNDSKATNVAAAQAAINGLEGPLVLILGGDGKGADFTPLRDAMREKVRAAVVIGRDADRIRAVLDGVVRTESAADMDGAVKSAAGLAQAGDSVLLSPACASLDMYSGYEERGRIFEDAVRGLSA